TIIWVANRDQGINNSTGVLSFHSNGSLILSDAGGRCTGRLGRRWGSLAVARVLDNANFVVTGSGGGAPTWEEPQHPFVEERRRSSARAVLDGRGCAGQPTNLSGVGGNVAMEDGAMDRAAFSGIPEMKTYDMFAFWFHNSADELYYQFDILNNTVQSRLGLVERVVWIEGTKSWNWFWFAPKDQCDSISPCGPFGICNTNDSPVCSCVQGFKPQSP
ncbi:hypothetical protein Taro_053357, partial [Colocasia esculenta]|nr:hypothetical protein [Colocasia esculenta]